jgi:hypothetical protein
MCSTSLETTRRFNAYDSLVVPAAKAESDDELDSLAPVRVRRVFGPFAIAVASLSRSFSSRSN